jgi:hypothetical protein
MIVLLLHWTIAPMPLGSLALFLVGAVLLIAGMGLFTLGADIAMMPMGERIGAELTKSRNIVLLVFVSFFIGALITIAEPDLQVLAGQVPAVPDKILILTVALGVGIFLIIALLRILLQIRLSLVLFVFYVLVFIVASFTSVDFLAVAFDSGGVTTGPITVPFILALGVGVAAVRGGSSTQDDSFGLVALCSLGPILAVLIMGLFYDASSSSYAQVATAEVHNFYELLRLFKLGLPHYFKDVAIALSPIVCFFAIFQIFVIKLPRSQVIKVTIGIIYTYLGLGFFLTGANIGFMPVGKFLGQQIALLPANWILIPLGILMGFFVVAAEPAVHVLNKQVEVISGGAISKRAMLLSLSIGVGVSVGLAMTRVLTGLSIWFLIIPGYALALILTFFVPKIFTGIAFDSGGVASGPMTATFLLAFAMGACEALGGNVLKDAFGLVAMVAMTPLITIQVLGLIYSKKIKKAYDQATVDETLIELTKSEIDDSQGD